MYHREHPLICINSNSGQNQDYNGFKWTYLFLFILVYSSFFLGYLRYCLSAEEYPILDLENRTENGSNGVQYYFQSRVWYKYY